MAANGGLGLIAQRIGSHLMLIFCCRLTGRCSLLFLVPLSISAPPKPPTCGSPADLLLPKEAGFSQRLICYSVLYADTDTLSLKDFFLNWVPCSSGVCNISVFCPQPSVEEIMDLSMLGTLKQASYFSYLLGRFGPVSVVQEFSFQMLLGCWHAFWRRGLENSSVHKDLVWADLNVPVKPADAQVNAVAAHWGTWTRWNRPLQWCCCLCAMKAGGQTHLWNGEALSKNTQKGIFPPFALWSSVCL